MVMELSCGEMSPTAACQIWSRATSKQTHTVYAVDADHVFQNRGALVWRLPVQQHAVCLYSGERHQRRNRDFEAKDLDQLLDGLGQDLVGAEGDPAWTISTRR